MNRRRLVRVACLSFGLILGLIGMKQGQAQAPKTAYSNMAPLEHYFMADRNAEIALARSAAPEAAARRAERGATLVHLCRDPGRGDGEDEGTIPRPAGCP